MRRFLILLIFAPSAFAQIHPYPTSFTPTENPISQSGVWVNGLTNGTHWQNMQTDANGVHGTGINPGCATGTPNNCNDGVAALTGVWSADQTACGVIYIAPALSRTTAIYEIEIHLNQTIASGNATGYEFNYSMFNNGNQYMQIVRWDGFSGGSIHFTVLGGATGAVQAAANGDVFCASHIGGVLKSTLSRNGSVIQTSGAAITDTTYTGGGPGIGSFNQTGVVADNLNFGFSSWLGQNGGRYTAATCNKTDVSAVIIGPTHTAEDGDWINIPAGVCAWTAGGVQFPAGVGIQIYGSGQPDNSSSTRVASSSCSSGTSITQNQFAIFAGTPSSTASTTRISCMTLNAVPGTICQPGFPCPGNPIQMIGTCTAAAVCPNLRVDNMVFGPHWGPISDSSVVVINDVFGVADHNTVGGTPQEQNGTVLVNPGYGTWQAVGPWGDNSWSTAQTFGTNQQFYLENNTFTQAIGTDMDTFAGNGDQGAGRATCRFNTFNGSTAGTACTNHGTDTNGRTRGGQQMEVYGNTITNSSNVNAVFGDRSSVSIHVNNALTPGTSANQFMASATQRRYRSNNPFGPCDGTSPWDNNDPASPFVTGMTITSLSATGPGSQQVLIGISGVTLTAGQWAPNSGGPYSVHDLTLAAPGGGAEIISNTTNSITVFQPGWLGSQFGTIFAVNDSLEITRVTVCMDQVGRGGGQLLVGGDCNHFSTGGHLCPVLVSTQNPGPVAEALRPSYEVDDSGTFTSKYTSDSASVIANRDFYFEPVGQAAQTTPTSPFNGGTGTGHGTLANRPTTCTVGVGYWATDQGSWNTSGQNLPDGTQQGQLYTCTSLNTWSLYYTPFTYPHTLISGVALPAAPAAGYSPNPMAFGSVNVGSSAQVTLTITNTGTATLTISGNALADTTVWSKNTSTCVPSANLSPAGTCTITVTFTPTAGGLKTTTLTITSNAPSSPDVINLSGTGVSPTTPGVAISPSSGAFGTGTTPIPFTITSNGTANLVMGTPPATITDADFVLQTITGQCTGGQSLAPSLSCNEQVGFVPLSVGAKSGSLNIFDNVTGSPQVIPLTGTGVATAVVTPSSLLFGGVVVNQNANLNVTIQSTANAPLTISSIVMTGTGFTQTNNCGTSVPSGGSCVVQVNFAPLVTGTSSGTLTITDNSSTGSPQLVSASGSGILVPSTSTGVTIQGSIQQ